MRTTGKESKRPKSLGQHAETDFIFSHWAEERRRLVLRHQRAWVISRQAADLLRREYGVDRVTLFGSLVRSELFTPGRTLT